MNQPMPLKARVNLNIRKKQHNKSLSIEQSPIKQHQSYLTCRQNISPIPSTTTKKTQKNLLSSKKRKQGQQENKDQCNEQLNTAYNKLYKDFEEKRNLVDQLNNQLKKKQIELLNNNTQYYEKEIKRLYNQVEKYQFQNEQNKHKFFIAENQKRQLQSTVRVKSQEVKTLIKQVQKQKIMSVELKHQLQQKDKSFKRITSELEKSNENISITFQQTRLKCQKLQASLKQKTKQLDQSKSKYQTSKRNSNENDIQIEQLKKYYEKSMNNKNKQLDELISIHRELKIASENNIQLLNEQIRKLRENKANQEIITQNRLQTVNEIINVKTLEKEKFKLQEFNNQLKFQLNQKKVYIRKLQRDIKNTVSKSQYEGLQRQHKQSVLSSTKMNQQLQSKIISLQKQLDMQKLKQIHEAVPPANINNCNEFIKTQLEQLHLTKRQLTKKIQENSSLKQIIEQQKVKIQTLTNEIQILNKKFISGEKNFKIQNDITSQHLKNDIESYRRKLQTLQYKHQNKCKQLKEKQSFITNTIIGRSRQEDTPIIIAEFNRIFESDYIIKLQQAHTKIQQLKKQIENK